MNLMSVFSSTGDIFVARCNQVSALKTAADKALESIIDEYNFGLPKLIKPHDFFSCH